MSTFNFPGSCVNKQVLFVSNFTCLSANKIVGYDNNYY